MDLKHRWITHVNTALAVEKYNGATARSVKTVAVQSRKLGNLTHVELMQPHGADYGASLVRLIDRFGNYVELDGLSWGYAGEGPHGLLKVFQMFQDTELCKIKIGNIARWSFEHAVINAKDLTRLTCTASDFNFEGGCIGRKLQPEK